MTLPQDFSGAELSLDARLMPVWDRVVEGILSHAASTPVDLGKVIAGAPDFALAQAVRGLSCLLLGRAELVATATEAYHAAKAATKHKKPTADEQQFVNALWLWLKGHPSAAADCLQEILDRNPRDALAMKLVQSIRFVMGEPHKMRLSVEALRPHWNDHPALGYLLGCHAFTLEESGDYTGAERAGKQAIELAPKDAWGLHAVAHVYDMTGRAQDGLSWLDGRESSWAHCNNFGFHVWWHRALMYVDLGNYAAALDLYDREIRAEKTDDYRDIANGTSLLMRLELEGIKVGSRWDELALLAENRISDNSLAFADLHYLLALIGGQREEATVGLIANMSNAQPGHFETKEIIRHPGHSAAVGLEAFGDGEYRKAFRHLSGVRRQMQSVGGSHAQRDVFERITIESALRGGYLDEAEKLLFDRTHARGGYEDGYTHRRLEFLASVRATSHDRMAAALKVG